MTPFSQNKSAVKANKSDFACSLESLLTNPFYPHRHSTVEYRDNSHDPTV